LLSNSFAVIWQTIVEMSSSGLTKRQLVNGSIELTAGGVGKYVHYWLVDLSKDVLLLGAVANTIVGYSSDTIQVKMQSYPQLYRNPIDGFKQTVFKVWILLRFIKLNL